MANKRLPIPLYFLFAFLVLFVVRDFIGFGNAYGSLRAAGIPPSGMWDLQRYPLAAATILSCLLLIVISVLNFFLFPARDPRLKIGLSIHCLAEILAGLAVGVVATQATGAPPSSVIVLLPVMVTTLVLHVPWIIYLYASPRARAEFSAVIDSPWQLPEGKAVDVKFARRPRKCPFCAENIKAGAIICRFCGRDLPKLELPVT